jgi:hypothetical protein
MSTPAPPTGRPVNDDPRFRHVTEQQGARPAHHVLPREFDSPPPELSPYGGAVLSPGGPRYSPSVHELLTRVAGLPSASWFLDVENRDQLLIATASGYYVVTTVEVPSKDGETVTVAALRRLAPDAVSEDDLLDLPELGPTAVGEVLASMVTDQVPGFAPEIVVPSGDIDAATVDLTDPSDPFAESLREALGEAQEGVLDRAVDDDADAARAFVDTWNEQVPDIPPPVVAGGSPAHRISQFARVDIASLTAIRRELDAFSSDTISARTSQRAVGIKLKVRDALVASGLGQAEVEWVEQAYTAGTRSAHTRGGGGTVGEVVGGTYVAVDTTLALAAASLRSREQARQVLGIRRVSR